MNRKTNVIGNKEKFSCTKYAALTVLEYSKGTVPLRNKMEVDSLKTPWDVDLLVLMTSEWMQFTRIQSAYSIA